MKKLKSLAEENVKSKAASVTGKVYGGKGISPKIVGKDATETAKKIVNKIA